MGDNILAYVLALVRQPFDRFPGVFVALAVLCVVIGFGLGRLPGAFRRRTLEKRLREAKEQARRADAEGRRFAELLGVTAHGRAALRRLTNEQLRARTDAFVSALRSQLVAWDGESEPRPAGGPSPETAAASADEASPAWNEAAKRLLAESSARLVTYHERFKVDAVMLRTEISRRLERPPERSVEVVTRVSSPVDPSAMAEVAGDLDALVRLLPDDGRARARARRRRRPARGRS